MNAAQKFAWFNLAVVTAILITVLAPIPVLRQGALGGLGLLGLLGIGPLFLRRKGGGSVWDERDQVIAIRSRGCLYGVLASIRRLLHVSPRLLRLARGGAWGWWCSGASLLA